jgi:SAM-dependent methyltransferase
VHWFCTTRRKKRAKTRSAVADLSDADFADHFSGHASEYAAYRPQYPAALYQFLVDNCQQHQLAWDCATGNGQAALSLAGHFGRVVATDASTEQIAAAVPHPKIDYSVVRAESTGIAAASIDLVTVAQALHWFDIDDFFAEVARVVKPGGLLAAWSYEKSSAAEDIDPVLDAILDEVEDYWPPERDIVMNRYRDISFPWPEVDVPPISMVENWTVEQMLGYFRTWSASRRYQQDRGQDPVALYEVALRQAWGDRCRMVSWPLTIRVARR